jgi:hypothetical protein
VAEAKFQSGTSALLAVPFARSRLEGVEFMEDAGGSPSNSAEDMTPKAPSPALKTVMQTMRVVARFHARVGGFEGLRHHPAPV